MWEESERYPDPRVISLDPSFDAYRLALASVERLATGFRWAEAPSGSVTVATCSGATSPTTGS